MRLSLIAILAICFAWLQQSSNASTCDCAPNYFVTIHDMIVCNFIPIAQTVWLGDPCPHAQLQPGACMGYLNCQFGCLCQMADWYTIARWNFPRPADWYMPNKVIVDLWNTGRPYSAVGCLYYAMYQRLADGSRGDTICTEVVDVVDPGEGDEGAVWLVEPDSESKPQPTKLNNSTNVIDLRSVIEKIKRMRDAGAPPQEVHVSVAQ